MTVFVTCSLLELPALEKDNQVNDGVDGDGSEYPPLPPQQVHAAALYH